MYNIYYNGKQLSVITDAKASAAFAPGAALCALTDGVLENSPYRMVSEGNEKELMKLAREELAKLYSLSGEKNKIAAMDKGRKTPFYTERSFSVSVKTVDEKAVTVFSAKAAQDLFLLEMLLLIASGKPLKKCEHCGGFFVPSGRSDAVYCDRIGTDGFSCKKIGAHRQYRKNSRIDGVKALYDKQTKHNRYLKNRGKISEREYERWLSSVSELYAGYKNGKVSEAILSAKLRETISEAAVSRRSISDYLL